jgi:hypothetical protein
VELVDTEASQHTANSRRSRLAALSAFSQQRLFMSTPQTHLWVCSASVWDKVKSFVVKKQAIIGREFQAEFIIVSPTVGLDLQRRADGACDARTIT